MYEPSGLTCAEGLRFSLLASAGTSVTENPSAGLPPIKTWPRAVTVVGDVADEHPLHKGRRVKNATQVITWEPLCNGIIVNSLIR
jgi:hypothetical protein